MIVKQGRAGYVASEMMLHCLALSAAYIGRHKSAAEIFLDVEAWHLDRGFSEIGYHFLVMPSGTWMRGRSVERIGAGCIGKNRGVIHVAMVESAEITGITRFADWFTEQQRERVRMLAREHEVLRVSGHNDYAHRLCPGFHADDYVWL